MVGNAVLRVLSVSDGRQLVRSPERERMLDAGRVRLRTTAINGLIGFAPVSGGNSRASIPQGWRQALRCAAAVQ
jgi:hypothetical protein